MGRKSVLIIGGGFAGISAAVELAGRGYPVTLIERRRTLGGRASSFLDRTTSQWVDNGQHILMGCYTETLALLRTLGVLGRISFQKNLRVDFRDEKGTDSILSCPPLPAPWHLVGGLLRLRHLPWADRLQMRRVSQGLDGVSSNLSAHQWLRNLGQSERAIRDFWNIFTLAAFNEPVQDAPASLFRSVLQEAFFTRRKHSVVAVPSVDLGHLWEEEARRFILSRGGKVLSGETAARLHVEGGHVRGLKLYGGKVLHADLYLSAVPPKALAKILPQTPLLRGTPLAKLEDFRPAPILTIILWTENPLLDKPFTALLRSPVHFIFQKEGYITLVISGDRELIAWPEDKLIGMAKDEIRKFFPSFTGNRILHGRVIKERSATFVPPEGKQAYRPGPATPIENLFLAGDWTDTGLPCTIEGAVRSGRRCTEAIQKIN